MWECPYSLIWVITTNLGEFAGRTFWPSRQTAFLSEKEILCPTAAVAHDNGVAFVRSKIPLDASAHRIKAGLSGPMEAGVLGAPLRDRSRRLLLLGSRFFARGRRKKIFRIQMILTTVKTNSLKK
jgi:hypothetical protein